MPSIFKIATALAVGALTVANAKTCPPMGAVLPPPQAPSQSKAVQDAVTKLQDELQKRFSAAFNTSAVSIAVKSIHEDDFLFNYHFTPPKPGSGIQTVDEHTVYRLASGTKLFTVLAALMSEDLDMRDSILEYLPELKNTAGDDPITSTPWEDISVESLAAHLSGLGVDMAQDLAIIGSDPWKKLGLPAIPKGSGPDCSGLPGTNKCTRDQLLSQVNRRPPVYKPYTNPVYSNIALSLLGYVVEAANNKTFAEVLEEKIFCPVGMNNSYIGTVPPREDMFIPEKDTIWNLTLGAFDAAGGMYSTVTDMIAFAEGIMTNKFLTPLETREWMKPASTTASLGYLVGRPWEILRSDNLTADGRLIDVYTKSGDLGIYHTLTGLIPEYDLVISVMSAGVEVSSSPYITATIFGNVLQSLLPALEAAGRADAEDTYATEFVDDDSDSSIVFTLDDGPGLLIQNWTVRGVDVLHNIPMFNFDALESGKDFSKLPITARVYPTNIEDDAGKERAWRAVFDTTTAEQDDQADGVLFFKDGSCQTWFQQDRKVYNYLSLDEFVFVEGEDGVEAVRCPGFNVTLTKA